MTTLTPISKNKNNTTPALGSAKAKKYVNTRRVTRVTPLVKNQKSICSLG